eukprot:CAMPEP_0113689136 /NCGR_PEP_ID=MMETSP0038_2-20120614/16967_1 /TAXON_ID=2898 /ORGANISM="Cryptomonas paramecium" /LENGTH=54 /DNA_ID=CAMNT_0000610115 /DNA_START=289 /DNA_END=450 /DNA_ORIENTATION=+ /assembly_acc=CAM_ASM_000170
MARACAAARGVDAGAARERAPAWRAALQAQGEEERDCSLYIVVSPEVNHQKCAP